MSFLRCRGQRRIHLAAMIAILSLGACSPKEGPDSSLSNSDASPTDSSPPNDVTSAPDGTITHDGGEAPDGTSAGDGGGMDGPVTCTSGGQTWFYGEYFFDGCNTCECTLQGGVICTARACPDDAGTPPFAPADAGMCAPETRRLQVIEYEVRYPCGIPGGPVGIADSRCRDLCAPADSPPPAASWNCGRTADPLVVFCRRQGS